MYIDKCFSLIFQGFDVNSDGHFSWALPMVFGLGFRYTGSVESPHGTLGRGPGGRPGYPGKECDISRCSILFETESFSAPSATETRVWVSAAGRITPRGIYRDALHTGFVMRGFLSAIFVIQ